MNQDEANKIIGQALSTFGVDKQLRKLQEELLELGLEVIKTQNEEINIEKLANEFADVEICMANIRMYMNRMSDNAFEEHYEVVKAYKLARLKVRIDHYKYK